MELKGKRINDRKRIVSGALIFVMMLMLVVPGINPKAANPVYAKDVGAAILYYEQEGTVFEKRAESGTARAELGLPSELDVVFQDEADANQPGEYNATSAKVPVKWEGYYDGDEPGVYFLSAQAEGYEYDGDPPTAIVTVEAPVPGTGNISGFLWVDGDGMEPNDWNGLYDSGEWPLANYPVYLYAQDDLAHVLAMARTGWDGIYVFEDLEPGSYVLAVVGESVDDVAYLPPIFLTDENKFAIDWSVPGLPAYTEVIVLEEGQTVEDIDAAMRYPMGAAPYIEVTLANLANANKNDTVKIDGYNWVVVKKQTIGGVNALYLIMRGGIPSSQPFGSSSDYNSSTLRTRMNNSYTTNRFPTMNAIALEPDIGTNHSSITFLTVPKSPIKMAGPGSQDVYFAPSLKDMEEWTNTTYNPNGGQQIPSSHPLYKDAANKFPNRFWFRTSRTSAELYGYNRLGNVIEGGLKSNGYDGIWDTYAVWVNANATSRNVIVNYIDTGGNALKAPKTFSVPAGDAFSLPSGEIPFSGYNYVEWRKSISGSPEDFAQNPNLTKAEVSSGKELYLVYASNTSHKITVNYIDTNNASLDVPPDVYWTPNGGTFTLENIQPVFGYRFTGGWKEGSVGASVKNTEVEIVNVTSPKEIFLIFEVVNGEVADGEKSAVHNGIKNAGTASNPVEVKIGDEIKYTIKTDNEVLPGVEGAKYDVVFLLDWSTSMDIHMVPGQSARLYERDIMLDMSDFILENYPNSRISILAMNTSSGSFTNNAAYSYIQYQTDFLDKAAYAAKLQEIRNAFEVAPFFPTEELAIFFRAANQKLEGGSLTDNHTYGSNIPSPGVPKTPIMRDLSDKSRTPVIIFISDFQIGNGNYWTSAMNTQAKRFAQYSPGGILQTVRLDHGGNSSYIGATYDNMMKNNVSPNPAGAMSHEPWDFTTVAFGTPYTEALNTVKSDFIGLALPGEDLGTVITDVVPDGLEVVPGSISHEGEYDPVTRTITWDLSGEPGGEITVEFIAKVVDAPKLFKNTANITHYDGVSGWTNSTYHKSALVSLVDVTISKTVTGKFAKKSTSFEFKVILTDDKAFGANIGKKFTFEGGVIPGLGAVAPEDGELTLDVDFDNDHIFEHAFFNLSHGQTITIKDVPVGLQIMLIETYDANYVTSIIDSTYYSETTSTYTDMEPVGDQDRRFDFYNDQDIVPTGIEGGTAAFSLIVVMILAAGIVASVLVRRRITGPAR